MSRPYIEYKDSGIEWLGEIPKHWETAPLKHIVDINPDKLRSKDVSDDFVIRYVDIGNVNSMGEVESEEEMRFGDAPSRARNIVQDGDTAVSTVRTYLKAIAYMDNPPENRIVSTGFAVLRPSEKLHPPFLGRLASTPEFVDTIVANSTGVSYPAINTSRLGDLPVWMPPLSEQRTIAAYLDRKTAQIDTLIAKKQRLIDLLQEQRTAVINRAVTQGLDPDAPMQDSGIEWLGEVPAHWSVTKLKFKAKSVNTGSTPSTKQREYYDDGQVDWYSPGDFRDRVYLNSSKRKITELALQKGSAPLFEPGTVLIVGIGATLGKVGIVADRCSSNQQINAVAFKDDYNSHYGVHYLNSISSVLTSWSNSATLPILNQTQTKELPVPVPPKEEQDDIVQYIYRIDEKTHVLVDREIRAIELLRELRTSLISEVVTGKIDVRDEVSEQEEGVA
jgi:type I restriction enzyme S subunit